MTEFFTTINTFLANLIGSFNPDDAFLIYAALTFTLFICSILIKGNTDNPNIYFLSFAVISGMLLLIGIMTRDDNTTSYHIDAHTSDLTTRFEKSDNYTASLSEFNTNNPIMTLNSYTNKLKVKTKDLPVHSSTNEATVYFKINGSPAGKETYTLPIIVENFTSDCLLYTSDAADEL